MTECKVRIEKNGFFSKIYINNNIIPKVKEYEVTQENDYMLVTLKIRVDKLEFDNS